MAQAKPTFPMPANPLGRLWLASRFAGHCARCRKPYAIGDRVAWYPERHETVHAYCCYPGSKNLRPKDNGVTSDTEPLQTFVPLQCPDHLVRQEKIPSSKPTDKPAKVYGTKGLPLA